MEDEKFCQVILGVMRGVYNVLSTKEINKEEWLGTDTESGVRDFIISLLRSEKKKAFMYGYAKGSIAALNDLGAPQDKIFEIGENRIGAEREFLEWEKQ